VKLIVLTILSLALWAGASATPKQDQIPTSGDGLGATEFDKILKEHWQNKDYRFDHASNEIKSFSLNLKKYSDADLNPGTAFGARGSVIVSADMADVTNYYSKRSSIYGLGQTIPTFKAFHVLEYGEGKNEISARVALIVKVPILPDVPVTDRIKFSRENGYVELQWQQDDASSPLLWNRGCVIIEPYGPHKVLATVYGVHVFKPEGALSWFTRPAASAFALEHYSDYLRSVQNAAKSFSPKK